MGASQIVVTGSRSDVDNAGKRAEMYDIKQNKWKVVADLNVARHYHSSTSFGINLVFIFCGINNLTKKYLNSIERFDLKNPDKWTIIEPGVRMPVRQGCGACPINEKEIMIFGGYSARMLKDAYTLNVETGTVLPLKKQPVIEVFAY